MSDQILTIGQFAAGKSFQIPVKGFATKHLQWLAKTRVGKTYGASKTLEQMSKAEIPWAVCDPVRAYWGLKTGFDNIVIFGDPDWKRTEMPLVEHPHDNLRAQAELIADLLVSDPKINAIIDMNEWSKASMHVFGTAFFWRMYSKNKSFQRMIVTEEADIFAPQQVRFPDEIACLDAYSNLVRRGASRGLGTMTISQRPALVQKDVLSQSELTFQLRVTSKADVDAFYGLIQGDYEFLTKEEKELARAKRDAALAEKLDNILSEVKNANVGEAFVYSPEMGIRQWCKIDKKETYHAGATLGEADYKADDDRVAVKPVDVAYVRSRLQVFLEEAQKKATKGKKKAGLLDTGANDAKVKELLDQMNQQAEIINKQDTELKAKTDLIEALSAESARAIKVKEAVREWLGIPADLELRLGAEHDVMMGEGAAATREINQERVELSVTETKRQAEFAETDIEGRLCIMLADGFFDSPGEARDVTAIHKEYDRMWGCNESEKPGGKNVTRFRKQLREKLEMLSRKPYEVIRVDGAVYFPTGNKVAKRVVQK